MKSLFGRKKKDEIPDVEDPEVSPSKESLHDIAENSETEVREELFRGMETEDNGLFEGMDTLQSSSNNNNMSIGLLGDGDKLRMQPRDEEEDDYDEDDDDDDEDVNTQPIEGMYDPAEFADLDVAQDVKELFDYIVRYVPQKIELDYKLKPFIPDFIPAVGDIDAFIKVESNNPLELGLTVLDEPSAKQSDPNIMELQLRSLTKTSSARASKFKTVSNVDKEIKVVDKWIKDIEDLHRSQPAPTIQYTKTMPEIDQLMQVWPHEVEDLLRAMSLPSAALEVSLDTYTDLICSLLDIPVYKSRIQVNF